MLTAINIIKIKYLQQRLQFSSKLKKAKITKKLKRLC
jgi:hypothetical protein